METWSRLFATKKDDDAAESSSSRLFTGAADTENTPFFEMQQSPTAPNLYTLTVKGAPVGMEMDSQEDGTNAFVKEIHYGDLVANVVVRDVAFDSDRTVESTVSIGDQLIMVDDVDLEGVPFSFIMDILKSKVKRLAGPGAGWIGMSSTFTITLQRKDAGEIGLVDFGDKKGEDACRKSVRTSVTGTIGRPNLSTRVVEDTSPLMILKIVGSDHLQIVDGDTVFYRVQVAHQNGKNYIVSKRFSNFFTLLSELRAHFTQEGLTRNLEMVPEAPSRLPFLFRFKKEEAFVQDRIAELNSVCAGLMEITGIHSAPPMKLFLTIEKSA